MSKVELPLEQAKEIAECIADTLRHCCQEVVVAGSIRRGCPVVGDIEIVAVPRMKYGGMFGQETESELEGFLPLMQGELLGKKIKGGKKYKQYEVLGMVGLCLDLFIATHNNFGYILAIRTGPASLSKLMVTNEKQGGLMPDCYKAKTGNIYDVSRPAPMGMEDESQFLQLVNLGGLKPEDRTEKLVAELKADLRGDM